MSSAELTYCNLIEAFFIRDAKVVFVAKMNQPHDAPEIIDPIWVIEWHAPAMRLGRKTA